MEFGAFIRRSREVREISLRELASKLDVSFTYLSKIENGVMPAPSNDLIEKLINALSIQSYKDEVYLSAERLPPDLEAALIKLGAKKIAYIRNLIE